MGGAKWDQRRVPSTELTADRYIIARGNTKKMRPIDIGGIRHTTYGQVHPIVNRMRRPTSCVSMSSPPPLCVRLDVCSRTRRKSALLIEPSALPQFLRIRLRDDDNKSPGGTDDRNSFRSATNTSASRPEYKHQTPGWTMAAGGGGWWPSQTGRCSIYGASFVVIIKSLGLGGRNVHFLRSDGSASVGFLRWPTSVSQTNGAADMISTGIRSIPVRLVLFFACHTARSRLQIGTTKRRLGRGRWPRRQFLSVICSLNWKDIPIGCEMASQSGSRTASM